MVSDNLLDQSLTKFKKIPGTMVLGIFAFMLVLQSQYRNTFDFKANVTPLPPPMHVEHLSFGFHETVADTLWIRSIQGFEVCDVSKDICVEDSWLFKMLDAVTNLSPQFRIPYAAGGLALGIMLSDISGATKIFEKGVKALPKDWTISYRAAYHFLYEVKDKKRAAELLIQAGQNGAPAWVFTLAGRLYSDSGELLLAENVLAEMKATNQDESLIQRLEVKIASMKKTK